MFTKIWRKQMWEVDARWHQKFAFRMIMNLLCIMSIVCAVITIKKSESKFAPKAFMQAKVVLVYLPCDAITIVWNMINIISFMARRKSFPNFINVLVHFFLGVGFAIIGIYVTVVCWSANKALQGDIYDVARLGEHTITSIMGRPVLVNADNVARCPGFPNCEIQGKWLAGAQKRAMISVVGCALFDAVFFLHCVFFVWCTNDTIFGLRGRAERKKEKDDKAKRLEDEKNSPILESPKANKFYNAVGKPDMAAEAYDFSSSDASTSSSPEATDLGGRPHISSPMLNGHNSLGYNFGVYSTPSYHQDLSTSRNSSYQDLVLKPSADSRESLSLSIFNNSQDHILNPSKPASVHSVGSTSSMMMPPTEMYRSSLQQPDLAHTSMIAPAGYVWGPATAHQCTCGAAQRASQASIAHMQMMQSRHNSQILSPQPQSQRTSYATSPYSRTPNAITTPISPSVKSLSPASSIHSLHSQYSAHGISPSATPPPPVPSIPQNLQVASARSSTRTSYFGPSQVIPPPPASNRPESSIVPSTQGSGFEFLDAVDKTVTALPMASPSPSPVTNPKKSNRSSSRPGVPKRKSTLRHEIIHEGV